MGNFLMSGLTTLNELLSAGIAITAFSLLLYVLSFNLRDRVTRSFAIILLCVTVTFVADALINISNSALIIEGFLKLQWVGIVFLPAAYLHISDALLEATGRPSRGRRRIAVRVAYIISTLFLLALPFGWLVGSLVTSDRPIAHLRPMPLTLVFTGYYVLLMTVAGVNFVRSYRRTVTRTSRRRMGYLVAGALAPALGSFPFLLFGAGLAAHAALLFWLLLAASNIAVAILLVIMAYSVAYFGVYWPDRVIKRRLAKWLMRGPVTASLVLALTTIVRRAGARFGVEYTALVPFVMVGSILIFEHLITLTSPVWERFLFRGREREDIHLFQTFEDRLLTAADLQQFLEALLATVCDRLQVSFAFVAAFNPQGLDLLISIGGDHPLEKQDLSADLIEVVALNGEQEELFAWGDYSLAPLFDHENSENELLGLLGIERKPERELDEEQNQSLILLTQRAALALSDRHQQLQAFNSLEALTPQIDLIQKLRVASRYDSAEVLTVSDASLDGLNDGLLTQWVRDALTHYWGGPKLTQSPLLKLQVVQEAVKTNEDNPTNALRVILRQAIEQTRPEGERRFTADWILYNILEMKFMEGRKVREIATRLAMSEADLYRKQRVAIEAVAKAIYAMEQQTRQDQTLASQPINLK
jgi:hypothetical protein